MYKETEAVILVVALLMIGGLNFSAIQRLEERVSAYELADENQLQDVRYAQSCIRSNQNLILGLISGLSSNDASARKLIYLLHELPTEKGG